MLSQFRLYMIVPISLLLAISTAAPGESAPLGQAALVELVSKLDVLPRTSKLPENSHQIGYTDLMQEIAGSKDQAVEPLLCFLAKAKTKEGRMDAIFTLHLLGLAESSRESESFKSEDSRAALLAIFLQGNDVSQILKLLIRDPWPSDVPYLVEFLKASNEVDSWKVVKALQRYKVSERPLHQEFDSGTKASMSVRFHNDYIQEMLKALSTKEANVVVSKGLDSDSLLGDVQISDGNTFGRPEELLEELTRCGFDYFGFKVEYYLKNKSAILCNIDEAKTRWLQWSESHQIAKVDKDTKLFSKIDAFTKKLKEMEDSGKSKSQEQLK